MFDGNDEIVQEFLIECNEHLDALDNYFVAIEQNSNDKKALAAIFRSIHTIKGGAGMLAFMKLEKLSHAAENLLSLLRDGKLTVNPKRIDALLKTVDTIRGMLFIIKDTGQDGEQEHLDLIHILTQLQTDEPMSETEILMTEETTLVEATPIVVTSEPDMLQHSSDTTESTEIEVDASPKENIVAKSEPNTLEPTTEHPEHEHAKIDTGVRIQVELIDKLMNLVGELVLSRNQVLQFISNHQDNDFNKVSQKLNLITTELQECVMKTRMQPIGTIWNKFPRVIRDLANTCNKKVHLEMHGAETELDKSLIEAIKDPLTHIIRNSIDHGIETPEARRQAGKDESGTLTLKAYHESGHVNIEISDDGAGISADKIAKKALEKGLISSQQAASMSEQDILNLIFLPGFSTAEKVSNVSGRGVGMDVVKTNIEKINGTVDLYTVKGKSTTLKIKFPLTLAIIPALIITCQNQRFAIPQINLLELVRIEAQHIKENVHYIKNIPVYNLRGKLLPLVHLAQLLGVESAATQHNEEHAMNIVVLQAGEIQFGVTVDSIIDTQEIVVKPLNKLLKTLTIYAGATIMGDGNISLILDVMGLANKAQLVNANKELFAATLAQNHQVQIENLQSFLLLKTFEDSRLAVPLSKVDRIEEFSIKQIEKSGKLEVVQYRNAIMPLFRLNHILDPESIKIQSEKDMTNLQVIVCTNQNNHLGLIVDNVYDIVEGCYELDEGLKRPGILGSTVIEEKVTEIIDIQTIMQKSIGSELANMEVTNA